MQCSDARLIAHAAISLHNDLHDTNLTSRTLTCEEAMQIADKALRVHERLHDTGDALRQQAQQQQAPEDSARGLRNQTIGNPFRDAYPPLKPASNKLDYRNGIVLTTSHGCTASEKIKLQLDGHAGVRIVQCINENGQPIRPTHPDAHYCSGVEQFPTFKSSDNQIIPYPY